MLVFRRRLVAFGALLMSVAGWERSVGTQLSNDNLGTVISRSARSSNALKIYQWLRR